MSATEMSTDFIVQFVLQIQGRYESPQIKGMLEVVQAIDHPAKCIELNADFGQTTALLYLGLPPRSELTVIGRSVPPGEDIRTIRTKHTAVVERCKQLRPDIRYRFVEERSLSQRRPTKDESLDLLFVSQYSSKERLAKLRELWWSKIRRGGCMLGGQNRANVSGVYRDAMYESSTYISSLELESIWCVSKALLVGQDSPIKNGFPIGDFYRMPKKSTILTAGNSKYFTGIRMLVQSVCLVANTSVEDLGLTWVQRNQLKLMGANVFTKRRMEVEGPEWEYYAKPFLIRDNVFDNTLWIDADCALVNSPLPLFQRILQKPFAVKHWLNPNYHPNSENTYKHFPVPARIKLAANCGVLGFNTIRDSKFLNRWCEITKQVAESEELKKHVGWWDEGTFHIAMQELGMPEIIEDRPGWNRPMRLKQTKDYAQFSLQLPQPAPDDVIWHFCGADKPWFPWVGTPTQRRDLPKGRIKKVPKVKGKGEDNVESS